MKRRQFLTVAGATVPVALAGCAGDGNGDDGDGAEPSGSDGTEGTTDDQDDEPDEPDYGDLGTYSFSGSGADVETGIELEGGLIALDATHDGSSNFQVYLVGPDRDNLFVNVIGEYDGETADSLDYGEYDLDVEADGDWEIEIRQPYASRGYDLPVDEGGEGPTLLGPYEFEGTQTFTGTHDGESNFQVLVYPEMAHPDLVFNEIGEYDGSSPVRFDGPGWIAVQADGNWTIEVE